MRNLSPKECVCVGSKAVSPPCLFVEFYKMFDVLCWMTGRLDGYPLFLGSADEISVRSSELLEDFVRVPRSLVPRSAFSEPGIRFNKW